MSATYLRQATQADLPKISAIIADAKAYLKEQKINQWQGNYPLSADLETDIQNGISYVLVIDGEVAGTAALHQGIDPHYLEIEDGQWANGPEANYTAIHRIALSSNFRGQHLSGKLISGLITISGVLGYTDVRIDTHPDNKGMQHVITSNGFTKRGIVYMAEDDPKRFAYQLLIN